MRILKLTPRTERWLLARRAQRDNEAQSVAAEIVADVRKRGDSALFAWSKKLDDLDLTRAGVWISSREIQTPPRVRSRSSSFLLQAKRAESPRLRTSATISAATDCASLSRWARRASSHLSVRGVSLRMRIRVRFCSRDIRRCPGL